MIPDDPVNGGHAQTPSLEFCGKKRIKQFVQGFVIHPFSMILDRQAHVTARNKITMVFDEFFSDFHASCDDFYLTVPFCSFIGIGKNG